MQGDHPLGQGSLQQPLGQQQQAQGLAVGWVGERDAGRAALPVAARSVVGLTIAAPQLQQPPPPRLRALQWVDDDVWHAADVTTAVGADGMRAGGQCRWSPSGATDVSPPA